MLTLSESGYTNVVVCMCSSYQDACITYQMCLRGLPSSLCHLITVSLLLHTSLYIPSVVMGTLSIKLWLLVPVVNFISRTEPTQRLQIKDASGYGKSSQHGNALNLHYL